MKWLVCLISDVSNMIMQVSICLKLIYVVMPLPVSRKIIVGEYSPQFSAGWRISEEAFIKDNVDWLSNLKLRLGWGKTVMRN